MFSIHGVTGQTFRGSLEHLIQVPGGQETDPRYARAADRPRPSPCVRRSAAEPVDMSETNGIFLRAGEFALPQRKFVLSGLIT